MVENLPCNAGGRGSIPGWDQDPTSHGAAEPTCARACTVESTCHNARPMWFEEYPGCRHWDLRQPNKDTKRCFKKTTIEYKKECLCTHNGLIFLYSRNQPNSHINSTSIKLKNLFSSPSSAVVYLLSLKLHFLLFLWELGVRKVMLSPAVCYVSVVYFLLTNQ